MKYRVVERMDGLYQAQYRVFMFWWVDSIHLASRDLEDQIRFAKPRKKQVRSVKRVVWPKRETGLEVAP